MAAEVQGQDTTATSILLNWVLLQAPFHHTTGFVSLAASITKSLLQSPSFALYCTSSINMQFFEIPNFSDNFPINSEPAACSSELSFSPLYGVLKYLQHNVLVLMTFSFVLLIYVNNVVLLGEKVKIKLNLTGFWNALQGLYIDLVSHWSSIYPLEFH